MTSRRQKVLDDFFHCLESLYCSVSLIDDAKEMEGELLIVLDALIELKKANAKFPAFNSPHEAWAVLYEEVDELWDVVKMNPRKLTPEDMGVSEVSIHPGDLKREQKKFYHDRLQHEATQVAAMGLRFLAMVARLRKEEW